MKAQWLVALAAGAAIGVSMPADVAAQGNSNRARQQQEMQRQRQQARESARREAERKERAAEQERLRRQKANRAGLVLQRDTRNRRDRDRDRDRDRRYNTNDRWDVLGRRDDRYDTRDRYDSRGPAFCRSGEGHPVHGRQWCRDKGFGLGRDNQRDIWGDIIYRDRRYQSRNMSGSVLEDILGSVVLGRFDSYGRSYYGNGSLNGRWLDSGASVLQLYMGSVPIARLIDTNRDGRVDNVSLLR